MPEVPVVPVALVSVVVPVAGVSGSVVPVGGAVVVVVVVVVAVAGVLAASVVADAGVVGADAGGPPLFSLKNLYAALSASDRSLRNSLASVIFLALRFSYSALPLFHSAAGSSDMLRCGAVRWGVFVR